VTRPFNATATIRGGGGVGAIASTPQFIAVSYAVIHGSRYGRAQTSESEATDEEGGWFMQAESPRGA
jgi:hypothetical protein